MWTDLFEVLLKNLGPTAVLVVVLGIVAGYLWRLHEKTLTDHISYLEKELAREQGSNNTLRGETRDFLERSGESRAQDRHQVSEMVSIMRDAIVDGRQQQTQFLNAIETQRRDALEERRDILAHIDKGMSTVVETLLKTREAIMESRERE